MKIRNGFVSNSSSSSFLVLSVSKSKLDESTLSRLEDLLVDIRPLWDKGNRIVYELQSISEYGDISPMEYSELMEHYAKFAAYLNVSTTDISLDSESISC